MTTRGELTLFSPAGVVPSAAALTRAARRLQAHGYTVTRDPAATARHQRFAGDDVTRLEALHRVAALAPAVALASRGGYGLARLLDAIDWPRIARSVARGTRWVGGSDNTLLQLAALAHGAAGAPKGGHHEHGGPAEGGFWHGPMACEDFGRAAAEGGVDEVTEGCFLEAMDGRLEGLGFRTEAGFDGLEARGRLWGGNLTLVASLLGTPHMPRLRGGILFLEDVNEHPYRVERNLLHLLQAGVLEVQQAVLLGHFTAWKAAPLDRGYTLKSVVAHLRSRVRTPILTGLPVGHVPTKVSLPQGRTTGLWVEGRQVWLNL